MSEDGAALYEAYASRDARFDGIFFVGVTSTGIYCRPVCTAKTPKAANCRFFESAAAAEEARFRPCLRCRPELAPGRAMVDGGSRLASRIAYRIAEGVGDDGSDLEAIAAEFHMSSRQLRRIVRRELGVSPRELILTRRLLLAKQLLTETRLPVIDIAYSSGFSSLRRFNDAFVGRYGMPPTRLRRAAASGAPEAEAGGPLTLRLEYRPPYDWGGITGFLHARGLGGVEVVEGGCYARTVRIGAHSGWIRVRQAPSRPAIEVELATSLTPVLPALLARIRGLFDLAARPDLVAARLGADPRLARSVAANPGVRVPGAFDGFELAVRAILGQQITVKAAVTLAGRYARAFGEPIRTPHPDLTHLSPTPQRIAALEVEALVALGIVRSRAASIVGLAREVEAGRLRLEQGVDVAEAKRRLLALPGIGPWTAEYIAMRALRSPDAFPKEDVALRQRLGGVTPAQAESLAVAWRPWRSYATILLWRGSPDA